MSQQKARIDGNTVPGALFGLLIYEPIVAIHQVNKFMEKPSPGQVI